MPGVLNGFEALANLMPQSVASEDSIQGAIEETDPIYPWLLLWTDRNHNGLSEPDELQPASNLLTKIGVGYRTLTRQDSHGNLFRYRGWAEIRTKPGRNSAKTAAEHHSRVIKIYDVFLRINQ
jgi:hypothetical protein